LRDFAAKNSQAVENDREKLTLFFLRGVFSVRIEGPPEEIRK
jgi:hypothetical protein